MLSVWITCLSITCLSLIVSGEDATTISISPSSRRAVGQSVTIICKVSARWDTNTVLWWRKWGKVREKIGSNTLIEHYFENNNRYQAISWGEKSAVGYKLSIKDLHHEDTAAIGCSVQGSSEKATYANLAVCNDVENQACLCIAKIGFNSPNCFDKDPSIAAWEKRYNMATTGLAVCLAIAIIYGLVMSGLAGVDCLGRMTAARKKRVEIAKQRQTHDPSMYEASEELVMDPNESSSQVKFSNTNEWKPQNQQKPEQGYNRITTEAIAHTNKAYNPDDDVDYQNIEDSPVNNHKNHNSSPYETYDAARYGPDVRNQGVPRTPIDGLYGNASDVRSPGAWSTHSAHSDQGAFRYPENRAQLPYSNGDVSPRHAQPSPRNAYSERPPLRADYQPRDHNLMPKQLYHNQNGKDYQDTPPQYKDLNEQYSANPSGAYIDKTGLSV